MQRVPWTALPSTIPAVPHLHAAERNGARRCLLHAGTRKMLQTCGLHMTRSLPQQHIVRSGQNVDDTWRSEHEPDLRATSVPWPRVLVVSQSQSNQVSVRSSCGFPTSRLGMRAPLLSWNCRANGGWFLHDCTSVLAGGGTRARENYLLRGMTMTSDAGSDNVLASTPCARICTLAHPQALMSLRKIGTAYMQCTSTWLALEEYT